MPDPASGILCGDGVEGGIEFCLQCFETACGFGLKMQGFKSAGSAQRSGPLPFDHIQR